MLWRHLAGSRSAARWAVGACVVMLATVTGCDRSEPGASPSPSESSPVAADPTPTPRPVTQPGDLPKSTITGTGQNILFVSVDTTRSDHLGCYGHPVVKTPNIDRLAAGGARFAWCISSAPLTFPSHSTMMTGSYPYVHGARDNGIYVLSDGNDTLAEIFKRAGYATHAEVAAVVLAKKFNLAQGFDTYGEPDILRPASPPGHEDWQTDEPRVSVGDMASTVIELERKADEITRYGIDLLQKEATDDKPFFIWLHYFDPHWPHEPPTRFAKQYPTELYYAEIAFFDEQFGKLIDALRELGLDKTTFVVLTSDHGEGRGQHGEYTHSSFLYDTTLHVPLIMWAPGRIPAGRVIESQVRLVDLAPTIVDFAGLNRTPQMQGVSLLPLIENPDLRANLPCYSDTIVPRNMHKYSQLRSLRTDTWKYILAPKPELYNVAEDRLELFNMVAQQAERAAGMREELRDLIATSPPAPGGRANRQEADKDAVAGLRALGYVADVSPPDEDPMTRGSELDHFEPEGRNPHDHIEEIDCYAHGLGSFRQGNYEDAEVVLKRLVELDPTSVAGWSMLGTTYLAMKRNDDALAMYQKALALDPADPVTHRHLGIIYYMRRDYDAAEKAAVESLKYDPSDWSTYVLLGRIHVARREFEQARKVFAHADELSPDNAEIKLRQGLLHLAMHQPRLAIRRLQEALRLRPEFVPALYHLGRAQVAMSDFQDAVVQFEKVIELAPEHGPAYAVGAAAYHELGNDRRMIELLRAGHEAVPDDGKIANDLAWWLATVGDDGLRDPEAAVRIAEKAAADAGMEHYNELDTLAAAYASAGKFDKAIETARRAKELAAQAGYEAVEKQIAARLSEYEQHRIHRSK